METLIEFRPTERDEANLAIIEATGLSRDEAIRTALTHAAADLTPVVWALSSSATSAAPSGAP